MDMTVNPAASTPRASREAANPPRDEKLWELSQQLEATFLAEMLKSAGLGKTPESFGGGAGEDQFSTFLVREHAEAVVAQGGIGLSESIYRSLVRSQGAAQ